MTSEEELVAEVRHLVERAVQFDREKKFPAAAYFYQVCSVKLISGGSAHIIHYVSTIQIIFFLCLTADFMN